MSISWKRHITVIVLLCIATRRFLKHNSHIKTQWTAWLCSHVLPCTYYDLLVLKYPFMVSGLRIALGRNSHYGFGIAPSPSKTLWIMFNDYNEYIEI
jgi:hypothetical protein